MNISGMVNAAKKLAVDNSPTILTAFGVSGTVATAVLAAKGAFKAAEIIRNEERPYPDRKTELTEQFKLTWKCYIPAVATGATTAACILGANTVSSRRNAALVSAYSLTEKAFSDYREKVVEQIGLNKEEKVREEVVKEQVAALPAESKEIHLVGNTDVLCYETMTGRTFSSNMEAIRKAENDINRQVNLDMYASLNEFWEKIGLSPTQMGEEFGWNIDAPLEVVFTSVLEDGKALIAIGYRIAPIRGFYKNF